MPTDPVVAEIRMIREQLAAQFNSRDQAPAWSRRSPKLCFAASAGLTLHPVSHVGQASPERSGKA